MSILIDKLKNENIKFTRVLWCDNANIIRSKSIHTTFIDDALDHGVKIAEAQMGLPVMYDAVAPNSGLTPVGEVTLSPDQETFKILPYAKAQALMIGDMKTLGDMAEWENCPRTYLKKQIERLGKMGLSIKSVFENEFYLLEKDENGNIIKSDNSSFAMTSAANSNTDFILDLEEAMSAQGLTVESYYSESGPGQHEFNIKYSDALDSADNQIIYRETVRGVAQKHGKIVSFAPKIFEDCGGNGTHLNFSLWKDGVNISGDKNSDNGIHKISAHFIAGILYHLRALCAVSIPSTNSYRRIVPHFWAGAFVSWGYYNREAAIRVSKNSEQTEAQRFELKVSDASANPYLSLGALIACGIDGIENKMKLPEESRIDPGHMPEDQLDAKGIKPLPKSLGEALEYLEKDDTILKSMGKELSQSFVAVRRYEWNEMKDCTLSEEVSIILEKY